VLVLGASLLAAFVLVKTKPQAAPVQVKEKAWLVSVEKVRKQEWSSNLVLYGRVESLWYSDLTAAVTADIGAVNVIEGNLVTKGDELVLLDEQDAGLVLAQRQAELDEIDARIEAELLRQESDHQTLVTEKKMLELTESEVNRARDLLQRKLGSQSTLDLARLSSERQAITLASKQESIAKHAAVMKELQAKRARAAALRDIGQLDLSRTRVVAPFNGRIARVLVSPGQRVRVGETLVKIYDTDTMVLRAQVPTRFLPQIQVVQDAGQPLVVAGDIDGQVVKATLLSLVGEVTSGAGGVEALFSVEGEASRLRYGQFVRLDLGLPAMAGLIALPHEAIYGSDTIYRLDPENRMRPIKVERVGETRQATGTSLVLVRSSQLADGDQIIVTQLPNAVDGLLVREAATATNDS